MRCKIICVVFLALLFMPVVFAFDLNIKTLPEHRISVIVREAGKLVSLDSFHKDTGTGEISFSSSVSKSELDLLVTLRKDGKNILNEKFESVALGDININFFPDDFGIVESFEVVEEEVIEEVVEEEVIEEVVEEPEVVEEIPESKPGITGNTISNLRGVFNSNIFYYIVGGLFVIGVLFFLILGSRKKIGNIKIKKIGEDYDVKLNNAEQKLIEAKNELDELKNRRSKLREAQERLKRDRMELRKLEGEGEI